MPLSLEFRTSLETEGVDDSIIDWMNDYTLIKTASDFGNFLHSVTELQRMVLDQIGNDAVASDGSQRMILTKIWKECSAEEVVRIDQKARGVGTQNLEDPMPDGHFQADIDKFSDSGVRWEPHLTEILCEPLFGRLKREINTLKGHTILPLDRVRSAAELNRSAAGKSLLLAAGLEMKLPCPQLADGPRPGGIPNNYLMVWLVQLLFLGGWGILGRIISKEIEREDRWGYKYKETVPFVYFQQCMDYLRYIRERVTPLVGPTRASFAASGAIKTQ